MGTRARKHGGSNRTATTAPHGAAEAEEERRGSEAGAGRPERPGVPFPAPADPFLGSPEGGQGQRRTGCAHNAATGQSRVRPNQDRRQAPGPAVSKSASAGRVNYTNKPQNREKHRLSFLFFPFECGPEQLWRPGPFHSPSQAFDLWISFPFFSVLISG